MHAPSCKWAERSSIQRMQWDAWLAGQAEWSFVFFQQLTIRRVQTFAMHNSIAPSSNPNLIFIPTCIFTAADANESSLSNAMQTNSVQRWSFDILPFCKVILSMSRTYIGDATDLCNRLTWWRCMALLPSWKWFIYALRCHLLYYSMLIHQCIQLDGWWRWCSPQSIASCLCQMDVHLEII